MPAFQVILFYKYVIIADPQALRDQLLLAAKRLSLRGRVLIAEEGINGTLEGTEETIARFTSTLHAVPELADMRIKSCEGTGESFPKLIVKVRKEIVGTRFDSTVDPRVQTAPRLAPQTLREWYAQQKDFVVVDMRNDYEYASGHFKDSINPGLGNSRDLPHAIEQLAPLKDKTVVTVCTGGVRCEKMSAFLQHQGFSNVYQLEDGMHGYMQTYPGEDFLGTLYTFDNRVTMDFGGDRQIVGSCKKCSAQTETYINCKYDPCHLHFLVCTECNDPEGVYCSSACAENAINA